MCCMRGKAKQNDILRNSKLNRGSTNMRSMAIKDEDVILAFLSNRRLLCKVLKLGKSDFIIRPAIFTDSDVCF